MYLGTAKAIKMLAGMTLLLTALSLSACGVKGPLEAPPEARTEGEAAPTAEKEKPHRGFILDGLLN